MLSGGRTTSAAAGPAEALRPSRSQRGDRSTWPSATGNGPGFRHGVDLGRVAGRTARDLDDGARDGVDQRKRAGCRRKEGRVVTYGGTGLKLPVAAVRQAERLDVAASFQRPLAVTEGAELVHLH